MWTRHPIHDFQRSIHDSANDAFLVKQITAQVQQQTAVLGLLGAADVEAVMKSVSMMLKPLLNQGARSISTCVRNISSSIQSVQSNKGQMIWPSSSRL
jgi:hypothetical protein